ncbi:hypothetical protein [Streptomyces sp. C1-2]|uniref:hypothetical protein n=1 Tax=Streptomyces sp. C1-2 TaxID=2720022 RepID=UPI0014323C53|nr:hypothetical protein [Streptomyces sp. C1-2]NJP71351.1 hypothetical protein [Streptomyces sp. C1-2]
MPVSKHDPYTARELAQILAIGVRVARRQGRGKPTKALEAQADRIREKAQAREDAKARARK